MTSPEQCEEELLVRRDKFATIARQMRVAVSGSYGGLAAYIAILWPVAHRASFVVWACAMVVGLACFGLVVRFESGRVDAGEAPRFGPVALVSAVNGCLWALAALPLVGQPDADGRWPFVYVMSAVLASASVISAASSRLVCVAYISPLLTVTAALSLLHEGGSLRVVLPVACLALLAILLFYGSEAHATLDDAIRMRHRNDLLARRLAYDASHDGLTGLLNRPALFRAAEGLAARLRAERRGYALVLVDIVGFKHVNDARGHGAGDTVLQAVAANLSAAAPPDSLVARLGGDEFVLVAEGLQWRRDAVALAERLREAVAAPVSIGERTLQLEASVGVAWSADGADDASDLLTRADWAMYQAKATDGARVAVFDEDMRRRFAEHAGLELALRDALAGGELEAWAQPIVTLERPHLVGVELLVRWQRPEVGLVPPGSFMPVAERSGLVADIGRFMLEEAAQLIERWQNDPRLRDVTVSVNIGARHLHGDDLRRDVERLVRTHPACRDRLVLELTETEFAENTAAAASTLAALQSMGVRVAIDDFGTGYSSLAYLQALPADVIKIDRSFVSGITEDPSKAAIVQAVIGLGATFGKRVVAEGIERPEEVAALRSMGCWLGQGYLFSRPTPVPELERLLCASRPVGAGRH